VTKCHDLGSFQGETMAKKRYYDGMYAGANPRRMQEEKDSKMIWEDPSAVANLPQQVVYKMYPKTPYNMPEGLDDTMTGVDRQIKDDLKRKKPINSEKY